MPQASMAPLLARWEQGAKGLLIYGWKVSGLLIRHRLDKSREQQFAPQQTACCSVLLMLRWVNAPGQGGVWVAQPCGDTDALGGDWCHSPEQSWPALHPSEGPDPRGLLGVTLKEILPLTLHGYSYF